ncbi:beta-lactamase family protein [Sphingobium sp. JS3065]|uniref:serine hydrolase domain-containing protein n=1 Tax=Sphingobium sp. JS3065 TaxID=2970925 RepID=UPI00226417ED|nr:serine hydrolase domain-containing protein [Sphingobium sp. JS3065]UZW56512.1 beta-lactamase family protein [Sphingobium sp. JS3065]
MQLIGQVDAAAAWAAGMDAGKLQALAEHVHGAYVASGKLPHMQLLVSRDERPLVSVHSGVARETGEPLREDALYRIASMTKPVTSVAFMMLVEQGLVALDDPVAKALPEFAGLAVGADGGRMARPMLMIDLLRHTSGLTYGLQRQTEIDARYRELGLDEFQQKRSSDEFIAALAALPLEFSPGERWNYSVSTDVLGVVVERLSGLDLERFFRERIFDPLGMADTFFELPEDRVGRMTDAWQLGQDRTLSLYDRGSRSGWRRPLRLRSGGGGLVSCMADYHRFARMLLRGGELDGARLLTPETVAAMHANHLPDGRDLSSLSSSMFSEADYAGLGFGLGFAVDLRTREYYWGGVFSTFFFIDPVERLIGIFMTQHFPSNVHPVRAELRRGLRDAIIDRRGNPD